MFSLCRSLNIFRQIPLIFFRLIFSEIFVVLAVILLMLFLVVFSTKKNPRKIIYVSLLISSVFNIIYHGYNQILGGGGRRERDLAEIILKCSQWPIG